MIYFLIMLFFVFYFGWQDNVICGVICLCTASIIAFIDDCVKELKKVEK